MTLHIRLQVEHRKVTSFFSPDRVSYWVLTPNMIRKAACVRFRAWVLVLPIKKNMNQHKKIPVKHINLYQQKNPRTPFVLVCWFPGRLVL